MESKRQEHRVVAEQPPQQGRQANVSTDASASATVSVSTDTPANGPTQPAPREWLAEYRMNNDLIRQHLRHTLPALLTTFTCIILLSAVDGLVGSIFLGTDALACVQAFSLVRSVAAALGAFPSASTLALSQAIGTGDAKRLDSMKRAVVIVTVGFAAVYAIAQIPISSFIISTLDLSGELEAALPAYAVGVLVATPLDFLNTAIISSLLAIGKVRFTTFVDTLHGVLCLVLDLLFVAVFRWGLAGIGASILISMVVCLAIEGVYLCRKTTLPRYKKVSCKQDIVTILKLGMPTFARLLATTLSLWAITWRLNDDLGADGIAALGVCTFGYSLASIVGSASKTIIEQLAGIYHQARNVRAVHVLTRETLLFAGIVAGTYTLVLEVFPQLLYILYGYSGAEIGDAEISIMRIYALYIFAETFLVVTVAYFSGTMQTNTSTIANICSRFVLFIPLVYLFDSLGHGPTVIWSYSISSIIVLVVCLLIYHRQYAQDVARYSDYAAKTLYLSARSDQATDVSREVQQFLLAHGMSEILAYKTCIMIEEMLAVAFEGGDPSVYHADICIRVEDEDTWVIIWDDGEPNVFVEGAKEQERSTDARVADSADGAGAMQGIEEAQHVGKFMVYAIAKEVTPLRVLDLNFITVRL